MQQHVVGKRNGCGRNAFAPAHTLFEFIDLRIQHPELRIRNRSSTLQVSEFATNFLEKRDGPVTNLPQSPGAVGSEKAGKIAFWISTAQLMLECVDKRDQGMRDGTAFVALRRITLQL